MNKVIRSLFASVIFVGSLLGAHQAQASVESMNMKNVDQSFVMQHAKDVVSAQDQASNLSWHTSHYSHESHASHASHASHYSGY